MVFEWYVCRDWFALMTGWLEYLYAHIVSSTRSSLMFTIVQRFNSPTLLSALVYCQMLHTCNCIRPQLFVGCAWCTATNKHNWRRLINFMFAVWNQIQPKYGVEEQAQGYGYSGAHNYAFSSSLYSKKMTYLLLLWPSFALFKLSRKSRLSVILDQRSSDIIYMTGPDLGFEMALDGWVMCPRRMWPRMENNQCTWKYGDEEPRSYWSRAKEKIFFRLLLDIVPIQATKCPLILLHKIF